MALRQILTEPNRILREKSLSVEIVDDVLKLSLTKELKKIEWTEVDNLSNWLDEQTVFIAITYNPYNENTTQAVKIAKQSNSKVILLTDTELNPIAHLADYLFSIHEAEIHTFRSLGATMCLVQAICISIGYHQQGN